jgi:hypothetical protein
VVFFEALRVPFYLSPGWLRIDPTFEPLRNNARFRKLWRGLGEQKGQIGMREAPPKRFDPVITDYYEQAPEEAERRETLLRVARMLETEPLVVGSSAHLLAVAQRLT